MKESGWSVLGASLVVPWCCLASAMFSLVGVTGVSFGALAMLEADLFPYLAMASILLLGRAHYLLYVKRQGNTVSRAVTWTSTGLVATLLAIQLVA